MSRAFVLDKNKKTILIIAAIFVGTSILFPDGIIKSNEKVFGKLADSMYPQEPIYSETKTSEFSIHETKEVKNDNLDKYKSFKENKKKSEKRIVSIDYGYINEDLLSNIKSFNEVLNYTGINYEKDLKELYEAFKKTSDDFDTDIEIVDPYGNIVSFKNCDAGLSSSSYGNFSITNGTGVVCKVESNDNTEATLRLIVRRKSALEYIKIDESNPIEKNTVFNENGTISEEIINAIEIETNVRYSMVYKYIDQANEQFYVGYIKDNSGVVFEATSDGVFF